MAADTQTSLDLFNLIGDLKVKSIAAGMPCSVMILLDLYELCKYKMVWLNVARDHERLVR